MHVFYRLLFLTPRSFLLGNSEALFNCALGSLEGVQGLVSLLWVSIRTYERTATAQSVQSAPESVGKVQANAHSSSRIRASSAPLDVLHDSILYFPTSRLAAACVEKSSLHQALSIAPRWWYDAVTTT